jgi:hypothetical protein
MPKDNIDYSNTIIYKIYCKDKTITDIYVGHTTNYIQRKYQHKLACNNFKEDFKIYKTIRENGGWNNWDMVEIAKYNCKDSTAARIKEQEHYELLNATLNSVPPYINKLKYFCYTCKIQCGNPKHYNNHINCKSHNKKTIIQMDDKFSPKIPLKFCCMICDYSTYSKKDLNRHLTTRKHKKMTTELQMDDVLAPQDKFICYCGSEYKYRQGLWKHKKNCKNTKIPESSSPEMIINEHTEIKVLTELVKDVIKQNQDLTNKIVDICKSGQTNNISHSNIHSNNKTFNLQFFLNETCKDAMNISEFIESIKFQLTDLEHTGRAGFVEGISNVVLNNLKDLDTRQRPIHCSDNKREILYIKDNNEWIKDDQPNNKMTKVIKQIASKNMKQIPEWVKQNPDCYDSESNKNDTYLRIVSNSMSGGTELEQKNNINKIISRVAKEVVIDKNL